MIDPFLQAGWTLLPARVDDGLKMQKTLDIEDPERSAVLSLPLFGVAESTEWLAALRAWQLEGVTIISDETHRTLEGGLASADIRVGSLRKMLPVPDGAFLLGMSPDQDLQPSRAGEMRQRAMLAKQRYLQDGAIADAMVYRDLFREAEEVTEHSLAPTRMTSTTRSLLGLLDYSEIARRRQENIQTLNEALRGTRTVLVNGSTGQTPSHAVIRRSDVGSLRAYLIHHNVFCPIHWPKPERPLRGFSEWRTDLMSIPIDQRYRPEDMIRVADLIRAYEADEEGC